MRLAARAVALGALLTLSGCAGAPAAVTARDGAEPRWQDVFDTTPQALLVFRPKALRRDRLYGPLLRRTIEAAREQSRVLWATPLGAMEDADEIIASFPPLRATSSGDADPRPGEYVVVVRGVRADLDPVRLVDADGRPVWTAGPGGAVPELLRESDERGKPVDASLFELPGRTWVIAAGEARPRAREAFAHPMNRPVFQLDPDALAAVRFDGPSLVAYLHERVERSPGTGLIVALGHRLRSATVELPPAMQGPDARGTIRATLSYLDEESAGVAEIAAADAAGALSRAKPSPLSWLGAATVQRAGANLIVTVDLPKPLLVGLLHADPL